MTSARAMLRYEFRTGVADVGTLVIIPAMRIHARLAALSLCAWMTIGAAEVLTTPASNPVQVSPEVTALAEVQSAVMSLSGDFRWLTETVDGSGEIREKIGIFAIVRGKDGAPTKYNVRISQKDNSDIHRWCSDGVGQWEIEQVVEDEQPTMRELKPGRQDLDLNRIIACVLLDLPRLTQDFSAVIETRGKVRALILTPLTPAVKEQMSRIAVVLDGNDPHEVIIDDPHNVRIRLILQKLDKNKELPEAMFSPVPKQ